MKLSVIMPVYNVEKTISLALDSVLMQEVDFDYEIIIVDGASTDSTPKIIQKYAKKNKYIKIIKHEKNQGNAISFYDGLCAAKGDYFCVLDGDDYYTLRSKLQRQVQFLDEDESNSYTAVVHKYLMMNESGSVCQEASLFLDVDGYTWHNFLQGKFYYHTSTYMYRNIFRGNVPECFKTDLYRGDNPRTFLHLLNTKGKVKVLNFLGSVYSYNREGIWSKQPFEKRVQRNIDMYTNFMEKLDSVDEKKMLEGLIARFEAMKTKEDPMNTKIWDTKEAVLSKFRELRQEKSITKDLMKSVKNTIGFVDFVSEGEYRSGKYKKFFKDGGFNPLRMLFPS